MKINSVKEAFIKDLESKISKSIQFSNVLNTTLDSEIEVLNGITINKNKFLDIANDHQVFCYLYHSWKSKTMMLVDMDKGSHINSLTIIGISIPLNHIERELISKLFDELDVSCNYQKINLIDLAATT